jgi:hypothetical protein
MTPFELCDAFHLKILLINGVSLMMQVTSNNQSSILGYRGLYITTMMSDKLYQVRSIVQHSTSQYKVLS